MLDSDSIWKALADPTRREILDVLRDQPQTTGELCERFDALCRTAVMKHLDLLVAASLVVVRREGRYRWNHLNPVPLQQIYERWMSPHVQTRAAAATRLKRAAERLQRRSDGKKKAKTKVQKHND